MVGCRVLAVNWAKPVLWQLGCGRWRQTSSFELRALELRTVSTGPGFNPRTQASAEPAESSQALQLVVREEGLVSALVNSLHGNTMWPDGVNSHWKDSVPGGSA